MHSRQHVHVRLRWEYPPELGQQSTIGPFAISETHPLIHEKMKHMHKQPPSPTIQLCSSTCLGDEARWQPAEWFEVKLGSEWQVCREGFGSPPGPP